MKQTQINGETYICCDLVNWMIELADLCGEHDAGRALRETAETLEEWGNDPERKRGVPNLSLPVSQ